MRLQRKPVAMCRLMTGMFPLRTKFIHTVQVEAALSDTAEGHHCGLKRQCPISDRLSYFHAMSSYLPNTLHDLFERIVPLELALCLDLLMKRKLFLVERQSKLSTSYSPDDCIT